MNVVPFDLHPLQPIQQCLSMVQSRVGQHTRRERKGQEVGDGVGCGEV